jgi:ABC-type uncharacterized transport system substrate-binding protein
VLYAIRRLWLGVLLIAATSAVLLIADWGRRSPTAHSTKRIALLQHANTPVLDAGIQGLLDGLAERGYPSGGPVAIERFNAQGDMPTGVTIARQVTAGDYDLVITSSTPSMQAVANNNREGKVRHVFFLVADPYSAGVGLDRSDPLRHPAHMVGQGVLAPVEGCFRLARRFMPGLKTIGVAWNPAESNSLAFTTKAREVAGRMGLTLLEANVDTTSAVTEAVSSLVSRGAQAIWIGGDNTVNAAMDAVVGTARRAGVPVLTILPGKPERGTLLDTGPDFYAAGRQAALLVADVLGGADISKIPIRDVMDLVPTFVSVNLTALTGLREPWQVPDDVRESASIVVDDSGVHKKAAATGARDNPSASAALAKKWKVGLVELNRVLDVEEAEKGVLEGLRDAGLVEGRDFERTIHNAQGDMATVSAMVDAALAGGADLLIVFSTPVLQAALQRAQGVPVVFNYVADAIAAGAGKSDADHAPNVTGVYLLGAYDAMLKIIRETLPAARVLGTVYVPAEVNMVSQRDALLKAAAPLGFEIRAIAANSSSEIGDAALALSSSKIDAICQLPGNLTVSAFPSIAQAARQARLPMFVFQSSQVEAGAHVALARDYLESGHAAAQLAARVMRGEKPAAIPFVGFAKTRLVVNAEAARSIGLPLPAALVARAERVIGR